MLLVGRLAGSVDPMLLTLCCCSGLSRTERRMQDTKTYLVECTEAAIGLEVNSYGGLSAQRRIQKDEEDNEKENSH